MRVIRWAPSPRFGVLRRQAAEVRVRSGDEGVVFVTACTSRSKTFVSLDEREVHCDCLV